MANSKSKIKVELATEIKRESVLLNSNGEVIEEGENSHELARKRYGKRRK